MSLVDVWQNFLQSRSNVGLLTMMYMQMQSHDKNKDNDNGKDKDEKKEKALKLRLLRMRLKVCYLLFLVVVAQLMIPVLLLMYSIENSDVVSFCPSTADGISRAVAFALGCIYQVRIILLLGSKQCEPVAVKGGKSTLLLQSFLLFDSFMDIIYELGVYFINLWIVFVTSDPLDMVLNALALEFVLLLDDVAKEKYISIMVKHRHCNLFHRYQDTFYLTEAPQQRREAAVTMAAKMNDVADAEAPDQEQGSAEDASMNGEQSDVKVSPRSEGPVDDVPTRVEGAEQSTNNCDLINYVVIFVVAQFVLPVLTLFYLPICKPQ